MMNKGWGPHTGTQGPAAKKDRESQVKHRKPQLGRPEATWRLLEACSGDPSDPQNIPQRMRGVLGAKHATIYSCILLLWMISIMLVALIHELISNFS